MNTKITVIVSALSLSLAACATEYKTPDGPPAYKQGYADGCASGNVAGGNGFAKFTKDAPRYDRDSLYKQGWDDGMTTCKGQFESVGRGGAIHW